MITHLDERLRKKIYEGMSGKELCVFQPTCILHNPDTEYKYRALTVSQVTIIQDFLLSYMDVIQITIKMRLEDYIELRNNLQNLECTFILAPYVTASSETSLTENQIIYESKVFLTEQTDVTKKINPQQLNLNNGLPSTASQALILIDYSFNIITKTMHTMRQIQMNAILSSATLEDTLHWICQQLNIEQATIIPPDNTITYDTLIIPPMKNIGDIFTYLQERYGVYSKGLCYYYEGDTMYIFPSFDFDQSTSPVKEITQIISAPSSMFIGNTHYHNQVDDTLMIVTNNPAEMKPLNSQGAENIGTAHLSVNADGVMDKFITIEEDGTLKRSENDITTVSLQNTDGNISSDMQNIKFTGNRNNIYASTSALAAYNGTKLTVKWNFAYPWKIKPGENIEYHYEDKDEKYETKKGRVQRIVYASNMYKSNEPLQPLLYFSSVLDIFLEPETASKEEFQYNN